MADLTIVRRAEWVPILSEPLSVAALIEVIVFVAAASCWIEYLIFIGSFTALPNQSCCSLKSLRTNSLVVFIAL